MTRRDRFRARGARGAGGLAGARSPQISDGVFQGATEYYAAGTTPVKPAQFTVIAYAPTAFPGIELWCYRKRRTTAADGSLTYLQLGIDPISAGPPVANRANYLWLDQIPAGEEFVPPAGYPPESQPTIDALKVYASYRWNLAHGRPAMHGQPAVTDDDVNWDVTVARPFQSQPGTEDVRIQSDHVYAVKQLPVPGSTAAHYTGWVWVPTDIAGNAVGREIWLHYRPGEQGGFAVPGTTPAGETAKYSSTRLEFEKWTPPQDDLDTWLLQHYATAITYFTNRAMAHDGCQAIDPVELAPLDYRVGDAT